MKDTNEIKNITVKEFVSGYKACVNTPTKKSYIKENLKLKTEYVSYIAKIELCKNLVEYFCMDETKSYLHVNSPLKHMFFQKTLIQQYTNLVIEEASFWEEYDLLKSNDLLKEVMGIIPKKEVLEFKDVLDMTQNDYLMNYTEIHTFIDRQVVRLKDLVNKAITPLIDELTNKLNSLDNKEIINYINNAMKSK